MPAAPRVRFLLRVLAVLLFLSAVCFWFSRGARTGWTDFSAGAVNGKATATLARSHKTERFHPGLDFLALGLAGSVLLLAASIRPGPR